MGYEAAKSHYVLYETDQTVVALLILVTTKWKSYYECGGSLRNLKS
jgi:hypothetical protein